MLMMTFRIAGALYVVSVTHLENYTFMRRMIRHRCNIMRRMIRHRYNIMTIALSVWYIHHSLKGRIYGAKNVEFVLVLEMVTGSIMNQVTALRVLMLMMTFRIAGALYVVSVTHLENYTFMRRMIRHRGDIKMK
jgi:hypothetical protein